MLKETAPLKLLLTGATGLVGEGVLLEALEHPAVGQILMVSRRPSTLVHPKLKELLVPDFMHLENVTTQLTGYDACLYCAGISSAGMNEADYTHITHDITMHFAEVLVALTPQMIFILVSGYLADSTEKGRVMWARVKGRTENDIMLLPFQHVYSFRPGFMKPFPTQRNVKGYYKLITLLYPILDKLFPNYVSTMQELGLAMIKCILRGYPKQILEVKDINQLANS